MKIKLTISIAILILSFHVFSEERDDNSTHLDNSFPALSDTELHSGGASAYIHTGTDKKTAFLRFGMGFSKSSTLKWDLSIETPYDVENDPAILGDFDGLSNVNNISFNLSNLKIIDRIESEGYMDTDFKLCGELMNSSKARQDGCTVDEIEEHLRKKKFPTDGCFAKSKLECDAFIDKVMSYYHKTRLNSYNQMVRQGKVEPFKARIYGINVKSGFAKYKFRNTETLAKESLRKTSWSVSAYYNFLRHNSVYGFGINFQKSYKENEEVQLCEAFQSFDGVLACSNARIGIPEEQKRNILYFQISHHAVNQNFAIQPKVSYDFEEDEVGVTVPVFLMRNKKGLLTGGLQVSWQSEDNDVVAGIFIGRAFKLF